jgi:hypothetical protein
MSFGGGGGGGSLISHTHNSSIVNDGGDLSLTVPTRIGGKSLSGYIITNAVALG